MIKGILFDKDGTLIDFYEVWGKAAVKVAKRLCDARRMPERQRMLLPGRAWQTAGWTDGALAWKSYRGVAEDLQEYLGTDPEKLAGELAELFYEEVGLKRTAYPTFTDVKAMMEALRSRGLWIGVATTDDLKSTRRCLEVLGVEEYISFWGVSGEGLPEKPDGRLASLAAGHWGIWKDEIAMVGDNPNDMRFARNGGAVAIGVKAEPEPRICSVSRQIICWIP